MSIIESANGVGARLAEARSGQGLSVEDLSSRTYIRPAVIRGIENDDFDACGGPFYARGHIRTLARTLGLEESPLLEQFDRRHGPSEARVAPQATNVEPGGLRSARARTALPGTGTARGGPNWLAVATVVAMVVCVLLLVGLLVGGPSEDENPTATAPSPAPATPSAPASASAAPAPPPASAAPPRTYAGVNLAVRIATGSSWVKVTDENGRVLASSTGTQGMTAEFQGAERLRFTFGNAAAVEVQCNGKPLGPLGNEGQVVSRTIELGDPACGAATG